jgi:hypothetical protein
MLWHEQDRHGPRRRRQGRADPAEKSLKQFLQKTQIDIQVQ